MAKVSKLTLELLAELGVTAAERDGMIAAQQQEASERGKKAAATKLAAVGVDGLKEIAKRARRTTLERQLAAYRQQQNAGKANAGKANAGKRNK